MIAIPRAPERFGKGWWPWKHARTAAGGGTYSHYDGACIECGGCGHGMALSKHEIAADGTVTPSVVCPYVGCGWHVFIRLEGWNP